MFSLHSQIQLEGKFWGTPQHWRYHPTRDCVKSWYIFFICGTQLHCVIVKCFRSDGSSFLMVLYDITSRCHDNTLFLSQQILFGKVWRWHWETSDLSSSQHLQLPTGKTHYHSITTKTADPLRQWCLAYPLCFFCRITSPRALMCSLFFKKLSYKMYDNWLLNVHLSTLAAQFAAVFSLVCLIWCCIIFSPLVNSLLSTAAHAPSPIRWLPPPNCWAVAPSGELWHWHGVVSVYISRGETSRGGTSCGSWK